MVAAAVIGAGVVGAVGSSVAAGQQSSAQKQAANTQQGMFNTINGQEQPFMQAGYGATNQLETDLGLSGKGQAGYGSLTAPFTAQDYLANQDPGYQFQLQTGAQATRNADTPGVGSLSSAGLKDLTAFNQNMASTGYQNAFNRYQTQNAATYQRLSGLAGLGQNAASNTGTAGTQLGTGIAQAQAGAGASNAAGTLGVTGALAGGANTLAGYQYLQNNTPSSNTNMGGTDFGTSGSGWGD